MRLDPFDLPALLAVFAAPRTYTGQDMAELQVPGNPALLDRLLHRIVALGARLAEPGEFTFRAYLAGKLDLTQAEGVAATIAATSDRQLHAAALLREGELGRFAARLVDELGNLLALVEAGIDFVDQDDVTVIAPAVLDERLASLEADLTNLLGRSRAWGAIESLPRIVLVGPPSSGKSTLFNALLGRQRAVIGEQPGTTRDVLAEAIALPLAGGGQVEAMLVDIAGLDDPRTALDRQSQQAARQAIASADVVLLISDGRPDSPGFSRGVFSPATTDPGQGRGYLNVPSPRAVQLRVRTKSDLPDAGSPSTEADIAVSARTGEGLDHLRQRLTAALGTQPDTLAGQMLALQPRHEAALREAMQQLAAARQLLARRRRAGAIDQVELVAAALRLALDQLAGLGGALTPDDVIGRVFSRFCIGK